MGRGKSFNDKNLDTRNIVETHFYLHQCSGKKKKKRSFTYLFLNECIYLYKYITFSYAYIYM